MSFTCDLLLYWLLAALVVLPSEIIVPAVAFVGLMVFTLGFFVGSAVAAVSRSPLRVPN